VSWELPGRDGEEGFAERRKKGAVTAEKSGVVFVLHLGLRLRAQKDAETKVTSLGDYLFFASIGL
jgi:hypothetical protein